MVLRFINPWWTMGKALEYAQIAIRQSMNTSKTRRKTMEGLAGLMVAPMMVVKATVKHMPSVEKMEGGQAGDRRVIEKDAYFVDWSCRPSSMNWCWTAESWTQQWSHQDSRR